MIYLASPYSDASAPVREARYHAACRQAAEMLRCGIPVFSPVAYTHGIASHGLPLGWDFWERMDRIFLEMCSEVWVLTLDGWQESRGVQAEIALAQALGKPVLYVEPDDPIEQRKPVATPPPSRKGVRWCGPEAS